MSTIKISELPVITGANTAEADVLPIVDTSLSTTNKITRAEFFKNVPDMEINDKIIHSGDTNTAIRFPAADTVTIETSGTERMRITSAGNVGIGTTGPTSQLSILRNLAADTAIEVTNIGTAGSTTTASFILSETPGTPLGWFRRYRDGTGRTDLGGGSNLTFSTGINTTSVERMRLDSSGNVGIGTTTPTFTSGSGLEVERTDANATLRLQRAGTSPSNMEIRSGANTGEIFVTSNSPLLFATNSTERMRIDSAGNVGIGTSSPNAASIVDAQSTTKGVRFPNMTTTQKNAIANVAGNVVFDTTLGKLCVNSGSGWQTITSI